LESGKLGEHVGDDVHAAFVVGVGRGQAGGGERGDGGLLAGLECCGLCNRKSRVCLQSITDYPE